MKSQAIMLHGLWRRMQPGKTAGRGPVAKALGNDLQHLDDIPQSSLPWISSTCPAHNGMSVYTVCPGRHSELIPWRARHGVIKRTGKTFQDLSHAGP